jgi:alkylated DNA repair dioxygenase AlkB
MQLALFGSEAPRFDPALQKVHRIDLAGGAWLEHCPGWLGGHQRVFDDLARSAAWQQLRRVMYERAVAVPRLVARAPREGMLGALLSSLALALARRYQRPFESISLAHYRDGHDSVAFHGDKLGRAVADSVVATVSVGSPRRFLMKPNQGGQSLAFDLGLGDLFVMGGTCQLTWQHAVPKRARAEPRISIMFRPPVPAD